MGNWSLTRKILVPLVGALALCFAVLLVFIQHATHGSMVDAQVRDAGSTIKQFKVLRAYYTENVVSKVKASSTMQIAVEHLDKPDAIPLPATMIHDLSRIMGQDSGGVYLKLYSAFPFPNRKDRVLDGFMRDAIAHLEKNPDSAYVRVISGGDKPMVRVAIADRMTKEACINCHNSLASSPKRDWKLGDVRGVLEVDKPLGRQLAASKAMFLNISLLVLGCMGALIFLVAWLTRVTIVKPLLGCANGLHNSSEKVYSASNQVSENSRHMAEGAGGQASSLEQTSASLEELTAMTRQNSGNARQANVMAEDTRQAVENSRTAMTRMSQAIGQIKSSSDETAKIVKTIDEIAFQTNLLALNAAVEAARAGDAGKGFAVVAEEVRNLARRSAEAAKSTSSLIEQSQKNAENGVAVSSEVAEILSRIVSGVHNLAQLIREVSTASEEQSKGLGQIGIAVAEMDKVTQSNAAGAEQSAAASEDLYSQSKDLSDMVSTLLGIVSGKEKSAA